MISLDYDFVSELLLTVLLGGAAIYIGVNRLGVKRRQIPCVSSIFIYPVKSCAEISLNTSTATAQGFENDRVFQVSETKGDASYCTPRDKKYAKLFHVQPQIANDTSTLTLQAPGMASTIDVSLKAHDDKITTRKATPMCGPKVTLDECGPEVARWFAQALGVPDQSMSLTRIGAHYKRSVQVNPDQKEALPTTLEGNDPNSYPVSLADEAPYLLTSSSSLQDLNQRLRKRGQAPVDMRRFRPNLVINDLEPWIEDTWSRIRIGPKAEFYVWQRCGRCAMTTIHRDSLQRGPEPLATLSTFRERAAGQRNFGMHLIPVDSTIPVQISVGDVVQVLEYNAARLEEWKRLFGKS